MPWKECKPMDERLRFIARLLECEKMAPLCREFALRSVSPGIGHSGYIHVVRSTGSDTILS
jgi:hypothetical protein